MHTAVWWLSRGKILKKVFLLRRELDTFLQEKEHENAHYFHDPHFLARLALLTDVFEHVNKLNTEFQGKRKWAFDFLSSIKAFVSKMQILRKEAETNNYSHFCHFQEFYATVDVDFHEEPDFGEAKKDLLDYLKNLTGNMNARFKDLITESLDFVQFLFKTDIGTTNCGAIAFEMAESQADNEARINFDVFQDIAKFCIQLPNKHSTVTNRALQVLMRFGTT